MNLRDAERQEVIDIEKQIDSDFHKLPFPHGDHAVSKWHLLIALEDGLRNALWMLTRNLRVEDMDVELSGFNLLVDRSKYSLRYGLERIYREQPLTAITPAKQVVIPAAYEAAASFIKTGDDYLLASRAFGSYHAGTANAMRSPSGHILVLGSPHSTLAYSALDLFIHGQHDAGTPLLALIRAFIRPESPDLYISELVRQTRLIGEHVTYRFNPYVCNQLMRSIPNPSTIVPDGWVFPWGGSVNAHRVFEALNARCLFHLLSIHFGALRFGIRGLGLADVCPLVLKSQLISELSDITGINQADVSLTLDALAYGTGTETPDPALQPLIPFSEAQVVAPTLLILSSNYPRNYLALHARVGSRSFDEQSELFEVGMSNRVELAIKQRFARIRMHEYLPTRRDVGEVDLLVADEQSQTILIGELRWLLQPGDPREVNNRNKVCAEKVAQVKRKYEAAREIIALILRLLGVNGDPQLWDVVAVVIVEGYVAAGPEPERFPVVPLRIFELGLIYCNGLMNLHRWLASHVWLPQKGSHFVSSPVTARFGRQRLQWGGFHILHNSRYLPDYIVKTATSFDISAPKT